MTRSAADRHVALDDCWNRIGVWGTSRASCPELEQVIHCRNCQRYTAAGRTMLERPLPRDYCDEWTRRLAAAHQTHKCQSNALLLFRLGDEWLGLDSNLVHEITEMRVIHSLPHKAGTLVKGLVNMRGELKICVSLGTLLQVDKAQEDYCVDYEIHQRLIHIARDGQGFVFPVSEVHGIHRYAEPALNAAPATVSKSNQSFTTGVLAWQERHVGVLDYELLFYALTRGVQ